MNLRINLLFFIVLLALFALACSFFKGSMILDSYQLLDALRGKENDLTHQILFSIRLPRTTGAFVTGGLLALAGALMQIMLRNPLADPYVLGVSGGAAVVSLLLILLGFSGDILVGGAWLGSLGTMAVIFLLAQSPGNLWNTQRMLLTGVALGSGFAALISFILLMSPERELRGMLFWLMGDLSYVHLPIVEGAMLGIGLLLSLCFARDLTILQRGELSAQSLGINIRRLKVGTFLLSSALTAAAVTLAGCIGFVGLIVPHVLRLLGLQDYRLLLPASVLLGGALVTLADTLARTIVSPQQLPVGILMALLGIPVFLFLLQKNSL